MYCILLAVETMTLSLDLLCEYLIASLSYIRVIGFGVEKDHQLSRSLIQARPFFTIFLQKNRYPTD